MDYYLKAPDEATMNKVLEAAGLSEGSSVDVIGVITKIVGYDEKEEPIVKTYPEWHVNVRGAFADDSVLKPFLIVPPETPYRIWA